MTGVSDATAQLNPFLLGTGWDVIFAGSAWITNITDFEIYQISLDGPLGSSVRMMINRQMWNYVQQGWLNYCDPIQPIQIRQTDEVEFCWNFAATAPPYNTTSNILPTVTLWLRTEKPGG
jgi:hypothetical protein